MEKLYDRIYWHNDTTPAVNESNLNSMSKAVDDIDNRVVLIAGDVLEVIPQIQAYLAQADTLVEALETLSQNPPYIGANGHWYVFDTSTEAYVDSGIDASISVTIADVTALAPDATPYVTNTGTDTDPVFHLFIPRGAKGDNGNDGADGQDGADGTDGVGISNIAKTGTVGNVDTYTITLTDGSTCTFTVTNAVGGGHTIKDSTTTFTQRAGLKFVGGVTVEDVPGENSTVITIKDNSDKMNKVNPTGTGSFSFNRKADTTVGSYSFAEGYDTEASGTNSHAEGLNTVASGYESHAEGNGSIASGTNSHAEGSSIASGSRSHAEGLSIASGNYQHVEGKFNVADANNKYAHIIGNGTADDERSNAFTVDWKGNVECAGLLKQAHYTRTIYAASWTSNSDSSTNTDYPYIYTEIFSFGTPTMSASDTPICQLFGTGAVTTQDEMADIALVQEIVSGNGTLTLYATDAPTHDLVLQIIGK